jgi:hypothetical protein
VRRFPSTNRPGQMMSWAPPLSSLRVMNGMPHLAPVTPFVTPMRFGAL